MFRQKNVKRKGLRTNLEDLARLLQSRTVKRERFIRVNGKLKTIVKKTKVLYVPLDPAKRYKRHVPPKADVDLNTQSHPISLDQSDVRDAVAQLRNIVIPIRTLLYKLECNMPVDAEDLNDALDSWNYMVMHAKRIFDADPPVTRMWLSFGEEDINIRISKRSPVDLSPLLIPYLEKISKLKTAAAA